MTVTTAEKPSARQAAPPEEDVFEAIPPEASAPAAVAEDELEVLEEGAEAEGDKKPAPPEKPTPKPDEKPAEVKPEAPKPEPEVPQAQVKPKPLDPVAREERRKRKEYAELWRNVSEERDKALDALDALRRKPATPKASKEYVDALKKKAESAEGLGEVLEIMIQEVDRRDERWAQQLEEARFDFDVKVSETRARVRHPDYDEVCGKAGIFAAVKTTNNQFADPVLARRIYASSDPGEMAYRLAKGKLAADADAKAELDGDGGDESAAVVVAAAQAEVKPEPKDKAPKADDLDRARQEGAREVIDRVEAGARRPRGISHIKPAAPPTQHVTREQIDAMADGDRERWFKKNPEMERFWLEG